MKCCDAKCPTIPIVRKCCFFVPIRKGVIIFGYVNLRCHHMQINKCNRPPPIMINLDTCFASLRGILRSYRILTDGDPIVSIWLVSCLVWWLGTACGKILTLLVFPFFLFMLVEEVTKEGESEEPAHMDPIVHLPLTLAFLLTDVIMYIVLLVGAHKRSQKILTSYLYFGLVFQVLTLCVDLVYLDIEEYLENAVYFFFLGLNVYLLFLVYCTVRVIEESSVQYVAHRDMRHLIM